MGVNHSPAGGLRGTGDVLNSEIQTCEAGAHAVGAGPATRIGSEPSHMHWAAAVDCPQSLGITEILPVRGMCWKREMRRSDGRCKNSVRLETRYQTYSSTRLGVGLKAKRFVTHNTQYVHPKKRTDLFSPYIPVGLHCESSLP